MSHAYDESLFIAPDTPFTLDVKKVAEILGASTRTVQRLAISGKLVGYKVGSDLRFTRPALLRYMVENPAAPVFVKPPSRAGRRKSDGCTGPE
jgi:excisionase family DNA binding protein